MTGYVIELTDETDFDEEKIKDIFHITKNSVPLESHLIALAAWMRRELRRNDEPCPKDGASGEAEKENEEAWHGDYGLPFIRWRRKIFLQNI